MRQKKLLNSMFLRLPSLMLILWLFVRVGNVSAETENKEHPTIKDDSFTQCFKFILIDRLVAV